jgi:apolipoprotein N-acyltransferase
MATSSASSVGQRSASPPRGPGAAPYLLAALSGFLVFFAFPPADLWPLAWVGMIPLFIALAKCRSTGQAILVSALQSFVFMAGFFEYLVMYGSLPWLALAAFEAVILTPAGTCVYLLWRRETSPVWRSLSAAAVWALVEFLRGNLGGLSLTLGSLGHTQHSLLPVLQVASVFGVGGITFLVVWVNAALAEFLRALRTGRSSAGYRALQWALVTVAVASLWGVAVVGAGDRSRDADAGLRVRVVQGNADLHTPVTDDDARKSADIYEAMTKDGATGDDRADLVVWPESALPVVLDWPGDIVFQYRLSALARAQGSFLLVGASESAGPGKIYNTAFVFGPDGEIADRYRKDHLVLFGEYVPYRDKLKFLERYPIRMIDYVPGGPRNVLRVGSARIGALICFEGLFGDAVRDVCRKGAQIVTIITSDAWAEGSGEVYQHSAAAVFPAVESRKWVVRAATTGRSAIISPYGVVAAAVPELQSGVAQSRVVPLDGLSLCHRGGWLALLVICAIIIAVQIGSSRPRS